MGLRRHVIGQPSHVVKRVDKARCGDINVHTAATERTENITIMPVSSMLSLLLLLAVALQLQSCLAGSCWLEANDDGSCKALLSVNSTREECCNSSPAGEKFFSATDLGSNYATFFKNMIRNEIRCEPACNDGCDTYVKRCAEHERCKVKNLLPRCVCVPNCAESHIGHKGPVCGTDGRTYRSNCQMLRTNCKRNMQVKVAYLGECQGYSCDKVQCALPSERCVTDQYNIPRCVPFLLHCVEGRPLCGTDNVTYASLCHLTARNIQHGTQALLQYHGACTEQMSCSKDSKCLRCLQYTRSSTVCSTSECAQCLEDDGMRVCATDGNTYISECAMRKHGCFHRLYLRVKHIGSCSATEEEIRWSLRQYRGKEDSVLHKLIEDQALIPPADHKAEDVMS